MPKSCLIAIFSTIFFLSLLMPFLPVNAFVRSIAFPVQAPYSFRDDFLDPRGGGTRKHLGIDIIAPKMTPVFSTADGFVTYVVSPEESWGYAIEIKDADGYEYSYLHLNNDTTGTDDGKGGEANAYVAGIERGSRVSKGQHIGWLGDSGNSENTVSHLHFEIQDPNHAHINPYESLLASAAAGAMTVAAPGTVEHAEIPDIDFDPEFRDSITRELAMNSHGEMVQLLQVKLKDLGLYTSLYITDYYDSITRDAVIRFQRSHGLEPTGIVDYKTRVILNKGTGFTESAPLEPQTKTQDLSEGSRGTAVTELQLKLKALGYYTSSLITDYFGPITKAAVISFQTINGIDPTGVVGLKTSTALEKIISSESQLVFASDLKMGSRGRDVDQLQVNLKNLGYYTSAYISGEFDSLTYEAVIRFQRAKGITPTGIVGPITRRALNPNSFPLAASVPSPAPISSSSLYMHTENLKEGSRGEAVKQLQLKLKELGYFTSAITDYFGPITKGALIRFQTANGIEPAGIVGPKTRLALNKPKSM